MNPEQFQVSDKVVLHPWSMPPVAAKPRIKRGRVYCVETVREIAPGVQVVGLAGVEFRRLRPDCRTRDPQGAVVLYDASTFQHLSPPRRSTEGKEAL